MKLVSYIAAICFGVSLSASSNSNVACSISSISIPVGTMEPVIVYNARKDKDNWRFTVLEKDHTESIESKGQLFYTDKKSGESWFTDKEVDGNQESMRDVFSLCRTLNTDNKAARIYEAHSVYARYETSTLPSNLALRVNTANRQASIVNKDKETAVNAVAKVENVEPKRKASSFLQVRTRYERTYNDQMNAALNNLDDDSYTGESNLSTTSDNVGDMQNQVDLDTGKIQRKQQYDIIID